MSARDDYPTVARYRNPFLAEPYKSEVARCMDEIDRLRAIKKSDDGAYEHVVEMYHAAREDCETWEATVGRLQKMVDERDVEIARQSIELTNEKEFGSPPAWPITAAIDIRDLLDVIAWDDDIPVFRRNEARQAVADFDRALAGDDAQ